MSNNGIATGIVEQLLFSRVPAGLSRGEVALLKRMLDEDAADSGDQLTRFRPGGWWIGSDNVSAQTCFRLLRHCLISMDGEESGSTSYWRVNDMGRMVANGATIKEAHASAK